MLTPVYTKQFEKDLKQIKKQHKNVEKLKIVLCTLIEEEKLDSIYRDQKLIGNWSGRHECHIESDWLLIYKIEEDLIIFERTGSHSDLFS